MRLAYFTLGIACVMLGASEAESFWQLFFILAGFACVTRAGIE